MLTFLISLLGARLDPEDIYSNDGEFKLVNVGKFLLFIIAIVASIIVIVYLLMGIMWVFWSIYKPFFIWNNIELWRKVKHMVDQYQLGNKRKAKELYNEFTKLHGMNFIYKFELLPLNKKNAEILKNIQNDYI